LKGCIRLVPEDTQTIVFGFLPCFLIGTARDSFRPTIGNQPLCGIFIANTALR
jgi:hypothetical protein